MDASRHAWDELFYKLNTPVHHVRRIPYKELYEVLYEPELSVSRIKWLSDRKNMPQSKSVDGQVNSSKNWPWLSRTRYELVTTQKSAVLLLYVSSPATCDMSMKPTNIHRYTVTFFIYIRFTSLKLQILPWVTESPLYIIKMTYQTTAQLMAEDKFNELAPFNLNR